MPIRRTATCTSALSLSYETSVDLAFVDGNLFSISSMRLTTPSSQNVVLRGYDAFHVQVGATHQVSISSSALFTVFSGLTNIASLRMSGSGTNMNSVLLDNFAFISIQAPPCFLTGTGIMTPFGRVPVEPWRRAIMW